MGAPEMKEEQAGKILKMDEAAQVIGLVEATQIVQGYFSKICSGFISFSVIAAINEKSLPYIAIRCKEHCLAEVKFRVHDVIVNRNGEIYSTKFIGIDGDGELPHFSGR